MKAIDKAARKADGYAPVPRVLLAWEYGRNYGPVSRLHAVAALVEKSGGCPIWALPKSCLRQMNFMEPSHQYVEAPANLAAQAAAGFGARSFADVLLACGFDDVAELTAAVRAWRRLFERICPHSVVLDSAPTALLTAHLMGLRTFQLTNGFDAPPASCPRFDIEAGGAHAERVNEARVLLLSRRIRDAARLCTGRDDVSAQSFFEHAEKVFDGVAETDPYGPRYMDWKLGPLGAPPHALSMEWPVPRNHRKRALVCMRYTPGGMQVLDGLARRQVDTLCAWPQAPAEALSRFRATSVRIAPCAVALGPLLPQADAVVSYGPSSFVCASLLAGKPQLMLPLDVEKHAIAQRVVQARAGVVWGREGVGLDGCLDRLLHAPELAARAEAIAGGYAQAGWGARREAWGRALMADVEAGPMASEPVGLVA
jgi:hypothetical protein